MSAAPAAACVCVCADGGEMAVEAAAGASAEPRWRCRAAATGLKAAAVGAGARAPREVTRRVHMAGHTCAPRGTQNAPGLRCLCGHHTRQDGATRRRPQSAQPRPRSLCTVVQWATGATGGATFAE